MQPSPALPSRLRRAIGVPARAEAAGAVRLSGLALLAGLALVPAARLRAADGAFRVETAVYDADDAEHPVARSLTLFKDGVAWDFLETLDDEGRPQGVEPAEIILHDPARERTVLVDPARNKKTRIDRLRLERLRTSLAAWARKSDDALLRWAGGPDFTGSFVDEQQTDGAVVLAGPRVRYEVRYEPAPGDGAAEEYRRFADTAILVKALVHPGGLPPFARIAINGRVAAADALPVSVRLAIDPRFGRIAGRPSVSRSEHRALASWTESDHRRVATAGEELSLAEEVDLAVYAGTAVAADDDAATVRR